MTTPIITVSVNGGAPQTGPVTVTNGDTIQLGCSNAAFFGSFAWRIFSHYGMSVPSGWTTDSGTGWYLDSGSTPSTFTIPAATWWGKILIKLVCDGDEANKSATIGLRKDSTNGLRDVVLSITADNVETGETNEFSVLGGAVDLQTSLRELETLASGGGGGSGTPRCILWDPDNATPDATLGEAQTEAQVKALVQAASGPATVYVKSGTVGTYGFSDASWDGQGSTLSRLPSEDGRVTVDVAASRQLQNWALEGLDIHFNNATAATAAWSNSNGLYRATDCTITNDGSAPVIYGRTPKVEFSNVLLDSSVYEIVVIDAAPGIGELYLKHGCKLELDTLRAPVGATFAILHDGSMLSIGAQSNHAGDTAMCPLGTNGWAGNTGFRPQAAAPIGYTVPDGTLFRDKTIKTDLRYDSTAGAWLAVSEDAAFVRIAKRAPSPTRGSGSYTTGTSFYPTRECYIVGARFWWVTASASSETVKVRIWRGGASVKSQDFTIAAGTNLVECYFTTPYQVTDANCLTKHSISTWDTSGVGYTKAATAPDANTLRKPGGSLHQWYDLDLFGIGDADPTSSGGTESYYVEPIYGGKL